MENQENKETVVKLFNKGLRKIEMALGAILPNDVIEVGKEEAEKLLKLFDQELVVVAEGQDPTAAANSDSAKCASLKKDVEALTGKLKDIEKSGNADVVEGLQRSIEELKEKIAYLKETGGKVKAKEIEDLKATIEPLKEALAEVTAEKDQLVKDLDKAKKELAKKKPGNRR